MEIPRVNLAEIRHLPERLAAVRKPQATLSADRANRQLRRYRLPVFVKAVQAARWTCWLEPRQKFILSFKRGVTWLMKLLKQNRKPRSQLS